MVYGYNMSIEKTVLAFSNHLSSILGQSVLLGWPEDEHEGVHLYIYSITDSLTYRPDISNAKNMPSRKDIHLIIFINPESDIKLFDEVSNGLQNNPYFGSGMDDCSICSASINIDNLLKLFIARNQPYQLTLPYVLNGTLLEEEIEEPASIETIK